MFISKRKLKNIDEDIKVLYIEVKRNTHRLEKIEKDMDMMLMNITRNTHAIHALLMYFNLRVDDKMKSDYSVYPLAQDFGQFIIKPKVKKKIKTDKDGAKLGAEPNAIEWAKYHTKLVKRTTKDKPNEKT